MRRYWIIISCFVLLTLQLITQIRLSVLDSQTTDEAIHLSAGYTYLTRGDYRLNPEHPPLVKTLAALPLLALDVKINDRAEQVWQQTDDSFFYDSWRENRVFGEELLYGSDNNPDELIFWGRLPIVALTFILGLTIFLIARKEWGDPAALIATGLYVTNPTVNAHGHLITTDIALGLGFLLATYTFWKFLVQPTWSRAIWFGLALALALLVKHTAVILLPVFAILAVVAWRNKERKTAWYVTLARFSTALVIALVAIWIGFGFRDQKLPVTQSVSQQIVADNARAIGAKFEGMSLSNQKELELQEAELTALGQRVAQYDRPYRTIQPFLSILPSNYLKGLFLVIGHASGGHSSFLLGETSRTGWWYYFPFLFLVKTPIISLLAILTGIYLAVRHGWANGVVKTFAIGGSVFLLSAITSKANLGLRHLLPLFPFIFVLTGFAATVSRRFWQTAVIVVGFGTVTFATSFPYYLPYFNEISGGPNNGYRIAADSNIDWGQDLKRIAKFIEQNNIKKPFVEYNWLGLKALDYYLGTDRYQLLDDFQPGNSGYAIINVSATTEPDFMFLANCTSQEFITPGVIGCKLGTSFNEN